jgi:cell division protein FtsZ
MKEISEAAALIQEQAHEEANIIFGSTVDEALGDNVKVTVIATGFDVDERMREVVESASRGSIAPATIPSVSRPAYSLTAQQPVSTRESVSQMAARVARDSQVQQLAARAPARESQPAPAPASRGPASQTIAATGTDRSQGGFPAFESDWDVPAFQRRQR